MKQILLVLLLSAGLLLTLPGFSQSMSNTDNVITLTNTCINGGVINGPYSLELNYFSPDDFSSHTVTLGVSVAVSGGVMTITAPAGSFPSVATNGWWSLPDGYPGHIKLTSGSFVAFMNWFQNPDGSIGFNCVALPVDYNSFTGHLSSGQVVLNWQTGLEQNSTVFEIYRLSGGSGSFYKIGQVQASGNTSLPVDYTFTDLHPCSSNTYYVKMLNSQGTAPISSSPMSVGCSTCTCTLPSPVFCNFSINGPDHICSLETPTAYNLSSSIPNYSTIAWSVDDPSAVHLNTYPDFDASRVTLLKKNTTGGATLTATLSGCTNTISRFIALGTPDPDINAYTNCPFLHADALNAPGATNFEWHWVDVNTGAAHVANTPSSSWSVNIINGDTYNIWFLYTNGCGTSNLAESDGISCPFTPAPGPEAVAAVSPNPTNGIVRISLGQTKAVTGNKPAASHVTPKVYEVRVIDALGVVQEKWSYPGGAEATSLDLSGLKNGVYIIQVFDNKIWKSTKIILAK